MPAGRNRAACPRQPPNSPRHRPRPARSLLCSARHPAPMHGRVGEETTAHHDDDDDDASDSLFLLLLLLFPLHLFSTSSSSSSASAPLLLFVLPPPSWRLFYFSVLNPAPSSLLLAAFS
eukprot:7502016-Pyramimonas_sp.AAC.1